MTPLSPLRASVEIEFNEVIFLDTQDWQLSAFEGHFQSYRSGYRH